MVKAIDEYEEKRAANPWKLQKPRRTYSIKNFMISLIQFIVGQMRMALCNRNIFVMNLDGSELINLTTDLDSGVRDPSWSPDG